MTQSRYFNAFILSSLTFLLLYFVFLSLSKIEKKLKPTPQKVIKIALITPIKKIIKPVVKAIPTPTVVPIVPVKKVEKKKPKKVVVKPKPKKVVKKKIVKKKVIKKVKPKKIVKKKIVKKKIIKKKVVKNKIVKKRVVTKPVETYVPIATPVYVAPKPVLKPVVKPTVTPQPKAKNNYHKKAFLRNVRSKIIANKKYPKIAKRRHIEGSVKVRFDISKHGQVSNIRFINGKRVFHKSIKKTLQRTFPMGIPSNVLSELPILNVSVVVHFNIR